MRLAEDDDTSNRPRNDDLRPRQPLEPRFQGCSVDEVWLLVKCSCGNWFGARKTAIATCPRCGSSDSCKAFREFHSTEQLAEAVATSNLPRQISQEVESRIAVGVSRRSTVTEKQRGGPETIKIIMKQSTGGDGTLTLKSLSRELEKEGIDEPSAEQIIGQAELGGILIRSSPDNWSWL
jgi:Zn ribbon nucleic-acid-binding protein